MQLNSTVLVMAMGLLWPDYELAKPLRLAQQFADVDADGTIAAAEFRLLVRCTVAFHALLDSLGQICDEASPRNLTFAEAQTACRDAGIDLQEVTAFASLVGDATAAATQGIEFQRLCSWVVRRIRSSGESPAAGQAAPGGDELPVATSEFYGRAVGALTNGLMLSVGIQDHSQTLTAELTATLGFTVCEARYCRELDQLSLGASVAPPIPLCDIEWVTFGGHGPNPVPWRCFTMATAARRYTFAAVSSLHVRQAFLAIQVLKGSVACSVRSSPLPPPHLQPSLCHQGRPLALRAH